jgi:hypothetical protein
MRNKDGALDILKIAIRGCQLTPHTEVLYGYFYLRDVARL